MPVRQKESEADRQARRDEYVAIRAQIGQDAIMQVLGISKQTAKIFATKSLERVVTKRDLQRLRDYLATRKAGVA